jgi:hypothetical protein
LLEQIDTLSTIATAFSNFAKMPKPKPEAVDLRQVLQGVVDLFAQKGEDASGQADPSLHFDVLLSEPAAAPGGQDGFGRPGPGRSTRSGRTRSN